ncbi:MAG TPA: hypothetical protein VFD39_10735, partial [Trueperaceae bacterium]|nr:hypothetical protein [Trueperaceae bacterium]
MRPTIASLACAAALLLSSATAQYANAPFRDQTLVQSQAYGLELVLQRLAVVDAIPAPLDDDYLEQVEKMLASDVDRFLGTLAATDPALAGELVASLEEVEEAAEAGEDAGDAVDAARAVVKQAYDVVVPAETRSSPVFIAAVVADLS